MPSPFDFKEYLKSICPEDEFEISVLTGGLVNFTVRAHRTSAVENAGPLTLRGKTSFILKHAPSYIATIGESAPFSQYRQARALDLFPNTVPFNLLSEKHPYIRVPRLLHHDVAQHILIIEDLGSLYTVDKWLETDKHLLESQSAAVGEVLGTFLADFHLSTTSQNREYLATQFKNNDIHDVIYSQVIQPVLHILNEYDIPNAKHIYEIIEREFRDVQQFPQKVLNLGDLWHGSILVAQSATTVGVIDWEFAGLAHPTQDIGQFGLSLHPMRLTLAAHLYYKILMEQDFSEKYRKFSADLFTSYGTRLRERNAPWLSPGVIDGYVRSLWIIHGRELINSTTFSKSCPCQQPRCHHLQLAVQRGVEYILGAVASKLDYEKDNFLQPIYQLSDAEV